MDSRKWVFEDVLADKSSPNYDPHEHPIAMLADDYYASRWEEDVYLDDQKNNNMQEIIDMRREPVRVNHFGLLSFFLSGDNNNDISILSKID